MSRRCGPRTTLARWWPRIRKFVVWDTILGLGSTAALKGDVSVWAGMIMGFYFTKRGFEKVARIIKR